MKVLLDLCLFGNRLVMIDILDADIDGYLPQSQRDSSTPSRNQSSLTQSSQRTASERVSLGQEPNTDTFRRKVEGGKGWATPSRNVSFVQYLSEHSSLVCILNMEMLNCVFEPYNSPLGVFIHILH